MSEKQEKAGHGKQEAEAAVAVIFVALVAILAWRAQQATVEAWAHHALRVTETDVGDFIRAAVPWAIRVVIGLAVVAVLIVLWRRFSNRLPFGRTAKEEGTGAPVLCNVGERPMRLSHEDLRHNVLLRGPIGSGKTTTAENLLLDFIRAGHGGGYVDPKDGEAILRILERIPEDRREDVILVDTKADRQVGINVLQVLPDEDLNDLVRQAVEVFRRLLSRNGWGERMDAVMRASLLTLMHNPGTTVCDVIPLLTDKDARRRWTANLDDPIVLEPFWEGFEKEAESGKVEGVTPVLARLTSLLLQPEIRHIFGQSESTVDLVDVVNGKKILLLDIGKSGEDVLAFAGSFIIPRLWQVVRGSRAGIIPEDDRSDWMLVVDEFQEFVPQAKTLERILAMSRSLHFPWVLCHQYEGQLTPDLVKALDANAKTAAVWEGPDVQDFLLEVRKQRSSDRTYARQRERERIRKIQAGASRAFAAKNAGKGKSLTRKANRLIKASQLTDLNARRPVVLERFQMAVRPRHGRVVIGTGRPRIEALRPAEELAEESLMRYGRDTAEIEQEMRQRLDTRRRRTPSYVDPDTSEPKKRRPMMLG